MMGFKISELVGLLEDWLREVGDCEVLIASDPDWHCLYGIECVNSWDTSKGRKIVLTPYFEPDELEEVG